MKQEQKIAIYVRTARYSQQSAESQQTSCLNFVEEQFEKDVNIEFYIDNGASGNSLERKSFQRLLSDINSGSIQMIVAYDIKGISRSNVDLNNLTKILKENKVQLITVTQGEYNLLQLGMLEFISKHLREDMSRSVKFGLQQKQRIAR
ncbi:recombinase family protein [Paenibacillus sp. FSL L8-0499]|uniref:recombinase family protein n=1 Tax=Paenibacillus sp. FSL L8-0499 TaxID=2975334 RepID=UPI0030FB1708